MTDPMSVAAAKVPIAPVPMAGQQAHAQIHTQAHTHAARPAAADAHGAGNGETNGASGSKKTQDGALSQILSDALKTAPRNKPNGPAPEQRKEPAQPERVVAEAVRTLKDYLGSLPSEMKFDYDEEADRQVFKVINPVTQEVVKQYPPDEFLEMVKRLKELAKNADDNGMLFDDRY